MREKNKTDKITFKESLFLFFSSVKRVWQYDKKYVILTCFVLTMGTVPEILGAFVTAIFNQRIILGIEQYESYIYAYYPLLIAFLVIVLNGISFKIWRWIEIKTMDKITSFLLRDSVRKASMIDFESYEDPEFYDRLQNGWSQDGEMFINSATTVFGSVSCLISTITYISFLAYIDWKLMLVITALRILVNPLLNKHYIWTYRLNNHLAELRRKEQFYRNFFQDRGMASEGKVFGLQDYATDFYTSAHKEIYKATFIHKIKINSIKLLSSMIYNLPLVIGYIYLSVCVYNGMVSLANMTLFISIYVEFVEQIYNTINELSGFRYYAEQSRYARDFFSLPTYIFTTNDHEKDEVSSTDSGFSIEFCNVTFRYPNTEKNVLENVSFQVNANETVSIIGANGAGKSTMIHLLMRLYDPTEGIILLNGKDIRDYSVENLYKIYGVLFQDYCNYAVSAKESITFSTESIMEENFAHSVKLSTAYKFIDTLENGRDTILSRAFDPRGIELSVGQKQRIALSRAYYKDAPVIILDEPSASIDPESEAEIFEAVTEMHGMRNIWLISHRLSTCVISDRILLFKDGRLIGNGCHNDLIKTNDEYKRMFQLQADRYEVS